MTDEERQAERQARVDDARARRAAREAAEVERNRKREREIEDELAVAVEDAIEKHGELDEKIAVVVAKYASGHRAGFVIVKRPPIGEWQRFRAKMERAKGVEIQTAQENLWRPNVVYPELGKVEALIEELPFFSELLGDAIGRLCGIRTEELQGK